MAKKNQGLKIAPKNPKVYEFKVSLKETSPLVWRTFLAHEFIELSELHMLIQMTMGWQASHLYGFKINNKSYGDADYMHSADGVLLCDILDSVRNFTYTYDFGDNWVHEIEITQTLENDLRMIYPVCVGGENACPPEDCGGVDGFRDLKKLLSGKACEEKDEMLSFLGGFYNPNTFDPNFVNRFFLWDDLELE